MRGQGEQQASSLSIHYCTQLALDHPDADDGSAGNLEHPPIFDQAMSSQGIHHTAMKPPKQCSIAMPYGTYKRELQPRSASAWDWKDSKCNAQTTKPKDEGR